MKIIGNIGAKSNDREELKKQDGYNKNNKNNINNINNNISLNFLVLLDKISKDAKINEGRIGVENILRCIYRNQPVSTKKISQYTKLPLPIVSKVRTILERNRILKRENKGAIFTETGKELVEYYLGFKMPYDLKCPECNGKTIILDECFSEIMAIHKEYAKNRPIVNTSIDQSYATPETATNRAAFMADRGDLEGKKILFIGDDDLTSIPTALSELCEEIVVMDIDDRLLNLINSISEEDELNIKTIKHDFRKPILEEYKGKFDIVFTDPPYTLDGLKLFISRAIEGLGKDGGVLYLAFSHKPIDEFLELQKMLLNCGFVIYELIPGFNTYEGSEIIGNTTFLAKLIGKNLKMPENIKLDKLYTGEVKPVIRYYKCANCGKIYKINGKTVRIENLKCTCGKSKFHMVKREKI